MSTTEQRERTIEIGTRIRLTRDVSRYPHFIAPEGAEGVVTRDDDELTAARMDQGINGAEEWDNEVHWFNRQRFYDAVEILD